MQGQWLSGEKLRGNWEGYDQAGAHPEFFIGGEGGLTLRLFTFDFKNYVIKIMS
jgi:hypothetical protein